MTLRFTKEGLLPEEILKRIRGQRSQDAPINMPTAEAEASRDSPNADPEYCFVVEGFAPELLRGVAFRLAKHYRTRGKKDLKCPHCGSRFDSVPQEVKVELRCFSRKSGVTFHNISWCGNCRTKVGIIYKSA